MIIEKIGLVEAVCSLTPNVTFRTDGDLIIEWNINNTDETQPTQSEIDAEIIRLQAEYDALAWKRSREAEYPSVADLVVALYDTDDKSAVEAKRAAVKAKYPKP